MKFHYAVMTLALAMLAGSVQAHGLWVAQRAGQWAAVYGEGAEDEAYDPAAIHLVEAWREQGQAARWHSEIRAGQWLFVPEEPVARLALRFDAGAWREMTDGRWLADGQAAGSGEIRRTWRLLRYASAVLASSGKPALALGLPLEIVPLKDPLALRKGDSLPVRLLLRGQPLANAKVIGDFINDDQAAPLRTDVDGLVVVTLASNGLNVIQASHAEACQAECTAERVAHSTTLSFIVPRLPE